MDGNFISESGSKLISTAYRNHPGKLFGSLGTNKDMLEGLLVSKNDIDIKTIRSLHQKFPITLHLVLPLVRLKVYSIFKI
jgi:hypothetical protein